MSKAEQISWALQKLIDTECFQRLRLIRQNGLANFVFHGAEHSRFSHSIGVQHVARLMFERICRNRTMEENLDDKMEVLLASLLHDVGHGAFSHTLEEILEGNGIEFHHETMARSFINSDGPIRTILDQIDDKLRDRVSAFFDFKLRSADHWKFKIVSSQMDADRLDYTQRDALSCGIKGHGFDFERLIDLLDIHDGKSIAVDRGAIEAVEAYLVTIDQLYRAIYYHQAVRAATQMLLSLFRRAYELFQKGDKSIFPAVDGIAHPLVAILEQGSKVSIVAYGRVSDATIWTLIEHWRHSKDFVRSDLSSRIMTRSLLKSISIEDIGYAKITAKREKALEITAGIVGEEAAGFYVAVDDPSRTSYKGYNFTPESFDESIWLTGAGKKDQPIEEDADSAIVKALKNKHYFPRLIVLDQVRDVLLK
ncbi:hypothetical protein X755_00395 [Mesorhizobium sp. LNJC405B00]|nr:hypothetical protein X755_00395 [Mesorhizobium sp. LNJC405B00]